MKISILVGSVLVHPAKDPLLKWKLVFLFSNFPNGNQMDENFANMRSLIQILDQTLYDTIQKNGDFSHFYFCYRYVQWYFKVLIWHPLHRLWHWKIFQSNKAETFTALFITFSCWNVNQKTQKMLDWKSTPSHLCKNNPKLHLRHHLGLF